jgi:hypothetical protein
MSLTRGSEAEEKKILALQVIRKYYFKISSNTELSAPFQPEVHMRRLSAIALALLLALSSAREGRALQTEELTPPTEEEIEEARSAPLFASHEILQIAIEADFSTMKGEDRAQDAEERPALLRWTDSAGAEQTMELQIGTRGNFRLQRKNCDFPPLRLNLKKGLTKGTIFETQDKLKLVVACKVRQDYWEQYVLSEYMAYRMLNVLTDFSFRVRLAEVSYTDTSGEDDPFSRLAFIIEDDDVMALRNRGRKMDWDSGQMDPRRLEDRNAILMDVFQYMIGNTDWSGVEMHNMELVRTLDGDASTIPFDFDFSGLVDARYAVPDGTLPIRRVRDRYFRGFCIEDVRRAQEDYDATYAFFIEKKDEIYEMWRGLERLESDRLEDTLEFLDDFYDTISRPDRIQSRMMSTCRRIRG